jgi:hypothetical protein
LRGVLGGLAAEPKVSIETTSLQIYRTILAATDQLTLMSRFEAQFNDPDLLTVLPFRSPHFRRFDGIATRVDWQPPSIHLQFIDLLRAEASRFGKDMHPRPSPGGGARPKRRAADRSSLHGVE